jgi:23S rRNA (guanine2445-N2)-methyltransferase / 23S rRNA (guanine2069-N7)-methyltransferase
MKPLNFFATCPKSLEGLLEQELVALGATKTKQTVAGVNFQGDLACSYRVCLWSRLANRVLLPLKKIPVENAHRLYKGVRTIRWLEHLSPNGSLLVDFAGKSKTIIHTHFGAQKVKDAIVDQIRDETGERPSVKKENPDLRINVYLHHDVATVSLDLSGESLHRRGYRIQGGTAPLKENLAAAILYRANWLEIAKQNGSLIDPMCGSGTILIEAALMAADIAPGLLRQSFGFQKWLQHDAKIWESLWNEAQQRKVKGLKNLPQIHGYDIDGKVIKQAENNIQYAGLTDYIKVSIAELEQLSKPEGATTGLVITNPPYGERMGDETTLIPLYQQLGTKLKDEFKGWQVAVLTGNPELGKKMGLRARKQYAFFNGPIACKLLLFSVEDDWFSRKVSGNR